MIKGPRKPFSLGVSWWEDGDDWLSTKDWLRVRTELASIIKVAPHAWGRHRVHGHAVFFGFDCQTDAEAAERTCNMHNLKYNTDVYNVGERVQAVSLLEKMYENDPEQFEHQFEQCVDKFRKSQC